MIVWDAVPLPPPLNGGVVAMSKQAGCLADAPQAGDDRLSRFHASNVRYERTLVNVDNIRTSGHMCAMTVGTYLKALTERAAKGNNLAKLLGYSGRSSVQAYLEDDYDTPLSTTVAKRFLRLVGKGTPPIRREEILAVCDLPTEANKPSELSFVTATATAVARIASEGPLPEEVIQSFEQILRTLARLAEGNENIRSDPGHLETALRTLISQHRGPELGP